MFPNQGGGGISNNPGATLTVAGSTINGNFGGCEGGIYTNDAQLTVVNSTISNNGTSGRAPCLGVGGGIYYYGGGTLTVTNSVISGNGAGYSGGGMFLVGGGTAMVTDSTIRDNGAGCCDLGGSGGGIYNYGQTLTVTNTTISGNSARWDGGGYSSGGNAKSLAVTNSTISGNSAMQFAGGGIYNSAGTAQIEDTILNADAFGGTISNDGGRVTSVGYNLSQR